MFAFAPHTDHVREGRSTRKVVVHKEVRNQLVPLAKLLIGAARLTQCALPDRWYSTLVAMTLFLRSDAVATSLASSLLLIWYSFVKVAGFVRRANLAQSFTSPDACNVLSELLDSTERLLRENSGSSERHPEENQLLLRRLSALIVERA
eukprot:4273097-Prorocentrum_lima.AAC.1